MVIASEPEQISATILNQAANGMPVVIWVSVKVGAAEPAEESDETCILHPLRQRSTAFSIVCFAI